MWKKKGRGRLGTDVKQADRSSPCRQVWTELKRNRCSTVCKRSRKMEASQAVSAKNEQICTRKGAEPMECYTHTWQEGC